MEKERALGLIHTYLTESGRDFFPGHLDRMGILAANILLKTGEIDKSCLTALETLSGPIEEHIKIFSKEMSDNLITRKVGNTTKQELEHAIEIAKEEGLTKIVCIANTPHKPRVEKLVDRFFSNLEGLTIRVVDANQVVGDYIEKRSMYKLNGAIPDPNSWPEQKYIAQKEKTLMLVSKIPLIGNFLVYDLTDTLGNIPLYTPIQKIIDKTFHKK